jgi:hypothetical protein
MGARSRDLPVTYHNLKVIHVMFPAKTSVLAAVHEGQVRVRCSESNVVVVSEKTTALAELENLSKLLHPQYNVEYTADFV